MSQITIEEMNKKFEEQSNKIDELKFRETSTKKQIWEYISSRFISSFIFFYLLFTSGGQITNAINFLMEYLEKVFEFAFSKSTANIIAGILTLDIYLILIFFIIFGEKTRNKWLVKLFYITIIGLILIITFTSYQERNPEKEFGEILSEIGKDSGENSVSAWQNFYCSTYGEFVRDEECISLQNTQTAEVQSNIKVGIQSGVNLAQKITLNTPEQGIIIPYSIETETPIKLVKFSCYVNRDELFYETTEFEKEIIRNEDDFNLVCNNIANKIEGKTETFDIVTKLEYNFEQSFSYKIPIINCQDNEILTRINKEETECNNLNFDLDTQTEIKSDNGVVIRVSTFQNNLPIYVGDQYQKNNNYFDLTFDKNEDLGEVKSIKFEDLTYPVALSTQQELIGLDITDLAFSEEAFNIVFDEVENIEESYPNSENYEYIQFNLNLVMEKTSRAHQNLEVVKNYQDETTQKEITIEKVISQFDYLMSEFERRVPQDSFKTETKIKLESIESRLDNLELRIKEEPENTFLQTDLETIVVDINTINQEISNRGIVIDLDI